MAYAGSDTDGIHTVMRADQQQQSPTADSSTVVSGSNGSETDNDEELFKLEMKLAWAERKHADFERMIQEERGARADVQARLEELEADDAKRAISVSNGEALKIAIEQKHTELEAARRDMTTAIKETDDTRRQLLISLATNNRIGEEVKLLKGQLSAADTRSQDIARSQALINNQQTEIDARKTQIGDLLSQNHQHVQDAQSQKQELENVREALALAEASRDWHRSEHTQMLGVRNTINAGRAPEIDRLKSEVAKLRREAKDKKDQIFMLKRDIAFYITHLDLANKGSRVYTCWHDNISNIINDGQNITCQKNAGLVANDFFSDWAEDKDFLEEYNSARQHVLNHHRAHESMKPGRGDGSGWIRDELNQVDHRRRVNVTYM